MSGLAGCALLPDKKIEWQGNLPRRSFWWRPAHLEATTARRSFFTQASNRASEGQPALKLAGIMEGTFGDAPQEIKIVEKRKTSIPFSNVGISAVIPAYKLYEVLFSEELKKKRGF